MNNFLSLVTQITKRFCLARCVMLSGLLLLSSVANSQFHEGYYRDHSTYTVGNFSYKVFDLGNKSFCLISLGDSCSVEVTKIDSLNNVIFDKRYSSQHYDILNSVIMTADGGLLICATAMGIGGPDSVYRDMGHVFKIDSTGNLQWSFTQVGGDQNRLTACMQATDSTFIIGGHYNDTAGYHTYIFKTDLAGNILWTKNLQSFSSYIIGITKCNDGGYAIITSDYCKLIRYDANDQFMWMSILTYTSGYYFFLNNFINANDGGFVLTGAYYNQQTQYYDALLLKLDSLGNMVWKTAVDAELSDGFRAVVQTNDGGFIAVGGTDFSGFGPSNTLLCKMDSTGQVMWAHTGVDSCILTSVLETSDGKIVVGGDERSYNSPAGSYFSVLDSDGFNCAITYDSIEYYIPAIGSVLSSTPLSLSPLTLTRIDNGYAAPGAFFYTNICGLTNGIPEQADDNRIFIFPNPSSSEIRIDLNNIAGIKNIYVYDVIGNVVFEKAVNGGEGDSYLLNISQLAPAIYFVRVTDGKKEFVQKLIKQ